MLTYEDCLALAELTEEEVEAVAEHEHLPEMVALEFANYLAHREDGIPVMKRFILDELVAAERHGNRQKVLKLKMVLQRFISTHPQHTLLVGN